MPAGEAAAGELWELSVSAGTALRKKSRHSLPASSLTVCCNEGDSLLQTHNLAGQVTGLQHLPGARDSANAGLTSWSASRSSLSRQFQLFRRYR